MKKIVVEICSGSQCVMMGAMDITAAVEGLRKLKGDSKLKAKIEIRTPLCVKACKQGQFAPVVVINGETIYKANPETVMSKIIQLAKS